MLSDISARRGFIEPYLGEIWYKKIHLVREVDRLLFTKNKLFDTSRYMIYNLYQWIAYWTVADLPSSVTIVADIKLDTNTLTTIAVIPIIESVV